MVFIYLQIIAILHCYNLKTDSLSIVVTFDVVGFEFSLFETRIGALRTA